MGLQRQALKQRAAQSGVDGLVDYPDCLAELEYCYSVFRFRHLWGAVHEVTLSNLADADDRNACMALLPDVHVYVETVWTDTLGIGFNGVISEITHRFVSSFD